jgi:hypothetical protein
MTTTHYNTIGITDKTGETTHTTIYNDAVTAVSIAGFLAALTTLRSTIDAITLGAQTRNTWVGDADVVPVDVSTLSNLAQRENKLLITYEDTTTHEQYTLSIGTLDLTKVTFVPGAKDAVLLTAPAEMVAFIAAFEAIASPPEDGTHNVKVLKARFVGRNS